MRPAYAHIAARAWQIIAALCISLSLSAQSFDADGGMLRAYQQRDMSVWKTYIDSASFDTRLPAIDHQILYEYGYCGYLLEYERANAKPYVQRFRKHVEASRNSLPKGHYEMYMSAVYVYELRLHESFRPAKAMSLAKESTRLAPDDPLVLAYYATSLFFAPKPFGSKQDALDWFLRAKQKFQAQKWRNCWVREMTDMYIEQCREKLQKK